MSELPTVTGKEAVAVFLRCGFVVARTKGSHRILKKEGCQYLLTVPVHGNSNLKPGTLRSLIRSAGLTIEQFVQLVKD